MSGEPRIAEPGVDLSKLRRDPPPDNGDQFLAWAVDLHGNGFRQRSERPRWCVVQWAAEYRGGEPYWRWSVPGRSTSVEVIGWLPMPWTDEFGEFSRSSLPATADQPGDARGG